MKKITLLGLFITMSFSLFSNEQTNIETTNRYRDSLSLGFKLEELNNNLGINFDLVSPTFINYFNARVSGGYVMEGSDYESTHNKYLFGLRGHGAPVTDFLKLYGEFGAVFIQESNDFEIGCYGLFGFEFYTATEYKSPVSYFIELGTNSMSTDLYNGFTTNVGLRYYF